MNDIKFRGAQKRIDFLWRWGLAFFAVFIILVGWLCNSIMAGEYRTLMFRFGVGAATTTALLCLVSTWGTHILIKRLDEHEDD